MKLPDRSRVCVITPTHDRRLDIGYIVGMNQCAAHYEQPFYIIGNSNISAARTNVVNNVLRDTKYDWLVLIDSDIVFTIDDWMLLWEDYRSTDIAVAQYSKKIIGMREPIAKFGLGFTRIHRSVFERIADLTTEEGAELVPRFYADGNLYVHYFYSGVGQGSRWLAEDHGFYMYASLTTATIREEVRTRLKHVGWYEYEYPPLAWPGRDDVREGIPTNKLDN